MRTINKVLGGIVIAGAAFGTIGAGAGATFTDAIHAQQKITAGTLSVSVSSHETASSVSGKTVTFAPVGPTQSTFSTGPQNAVITNTGDVTASAITLSASDDASDAASNYLRDQLFVRVFSSNVVVYDGPLTGLENNPIAIAGPLSPNQTDDFDTTFYAGGDAAHPSLDNNAQGGVLTPKITVSYTG
jgi:hypothetical protein